MAETRVQIVATTGPASSTRETLTAMVGAGLDVVRLNFAWSTLEEFQKQIEYIRSIAAQRGKPIPIIQDLPGPRIQTGGEHTYDQSVRQLLTPEDERSIQFGVEQKIEYAALSFVGGAEDVESGREMIRKHGGSQKIIAKIERKVALDNIDAIIAATDALMVARGDLGNEVPLEEIPFIEAMLIKKGNDAGKPVIVATQMFESMVEKPQPTRAEVTDVAFAVLQGASAVMLSEETARGKYPVEAVTMMEHVLSIAQRHLGRINTRGL